MINRRQTIRLNESMLNRIIKESVKRVLKEGIEMDNGAPYYVYIDNDCIKEFNDINKAIKFAKALSEKYPDATIDVNDSSDENSVWGVN